MEADADEFNINELYRDALPRNSEETRALDQNLIERGQLEPVKVNRNMTPLDGHTRIQLLGDRGKKIKYEFRDFKTVEEELDYVVECNVMRRQLTPYQRVEAMYKLFGGKRYTRDNSDKFKRAYIDVLESIKKGNIISSTIIKSINMESSNTRRTLKIMTDEYYIGRDEEKLPSGGQQFVYKVLPKGESLLANKPLTKTTVQIGKDIGLHRDVVGKALALLDKADGDLKTKLINGTLTIGQAHSIMMGRKKPHKYKRWSPNTKIRCPHCNNISQKHQFEVVL